MHPTYLCELVLSMILLRPDFANKGLKQSRDGSKENTHFRFWRNLLLIVRYLGWAVKIGSGAHRGGFHERHRELRRATCGRSYRQFIVKVLALNHSSDTTLLSENR